MKEVFKAVKISEKVYWVGAIDWNVRNFHGYRTSRGTTYNAFLVLDKKVTLIDTVKHNFFDEMLARISSVIDPGKIDYLVSNHAEPDHSGSILETVAAIKPDKIFASPMGEKALKAYYGELPISVVKTGDSIDLGDSKLTFVETKLLHWPDSMVTYLDTEKMLFSQDAFGMHLAGSKLFADEYPRWVLEHEAKKYFANILLHLSPKVLELLNALPSFHLDIQVVAPDHGPLWRTKEDIAWILDLYRTCAEQKYQARAIVCYTSMWGSTERLANAIADGIRTTGVEVKVSDLAENERSAIMTDIEDSSLCVFGAPTMNNQVYPSMADILTYAKGLRPQNKIGAAFGSFGWSGEGAKFIASELEAMNMEKVTEVLQVKYMPATADLEKAFQMGVTLGNALLAKLK